MRTGEGLLRAGVGGGGGEADAAGQRHSTGCGAGDDVHWAGRLPLYGRGSLR